MKSKKILTDLTGFLPLVLQTADDPDQRYRGSFLGQVADDLILVKVEENPPIAENQKIIVRMVEEGNAIGFESILLKVVESPVLLYFLSKPDNVEVVSLRKAERMDVFVPADVRHTTKTGDDSDTRILQGYMTNISSGGCRMLTKNPIKAKSVVHLSFNLPLEKHLYTISGTVLEGATPKGQQKSIFGHRIRFFPSDKNTQDIGEIRRWVDQNMDFTDLFP